MARTARLWEVRLAHNLADKLLEALFDVCQTAASDDITPDLATLEVFFWRIESAYLDHVQAVFARTATERKPICKFWTDSCHGSVKAVGDHVRKLMLPFVDSSTIKYEKIVESDGALSPAIARSYFKAMVPDDELEIVQGHWHEIRGQIRLLGQIDLEEVRFTLGRELRDAEDRCKQVDQQRDQDVFRRESRKQWDADTKSQAEREAATETPKWRDLLHEHDDEPPKEFRRDGKDSGESNGPITGSMAALGFARHRGKKVTDEQYRNQIRSDVLASRIWVRKTRDGSDKRYFDMFVKSWAERTACLEAVVLYAPDTTERN